ncbi:hypothetical protein HC256_006708 [Beauveria bassiana]|nr:hypothetical protein HC256_006708 [Beauveria bassiana]
MEALQHEDSAHGRLCEQFAAYITQSSAQLQHERTQLQHERTQSDERLRQVSLYAEDQRGQLEQRRQELERLQAEAQQLRSDNQILTNVITYLQREMRTQRCWLEDLRQQLVAQNQAMCVLNQSSYQAPPTVPSLSLIHYDPPLQARPQSSEADA